MTAGKAGKSRRAEGARRPDQAARVSERLVEDNSPPPGSAANGKIRIFLADDHAMVREALSALLAQEDDLEVVGCCGNGLEVLPEVRRCRPHVVLLDVAMPGLSGLDVCRRLTEEFPDAAVLILSAHDNDQYVARSWSNGAAGYLLKELAAEHLAEAVRKAARGAPCLGPGMPRGLLKRIASGNVDPYESLSARERQVLRLIAEGKTNPRIAEELGLSYKTIGTHRERLMRKLDIHDQTSLVKFAISRGIVSLE